MYTRKIQERPKKAPSRRRSQHTQQTSSTELPKNKEEDEAEEPIYVFDKSDNGDGPDKKLSQTAVLLSV